MPKRVIGSHKSKTGRQWPIEKGNNDKQWSKKKYTEN
jgi:hypothetical protein